MTFRPNRKAEFDRKAENISSLILRGKLTRRVILGRFISYDMVKFGLPVFL